MVSWRAAIWSWVSLFPERSLDRHVKVRFGRTHPIHSQTRWSNFTAKETKGRPLSFYSDIKYYCWSFDVVNGGHFQLVSQCNWFPQKCYPAFFRFTKSRFHPFLFPTPIRKKCFIAKPIYYQFSVNPHANDFQWMEPVIIGASSYGWLGSVFQSKESRLIQ